MKLRSLSFALLAAAVAVAAVANPLHEERVTAPFAVGKDIKIDVTSPPFERANQRHILVRLDDVRFSVPVDGRLTARGRGSITMAGRADYSLRIDLLAADGKEVSRAQVTEHVKHIELGRVLTGMREWCFDFGRPADIAKVKSFTAEIIRIAARADEKRAAT